MRVYIANFGEGNILWPKAKANSTIAIYDNVLTHQFWRSGDREAYIAASIQNVRNASGRAPNRITASRWYNLSTELRALSDQMESFDRSDRATTQGLRAAI